LDIDKGNPHESLTEIVEILTKNIEIEMCRDGFNIGGAAPKFGIVPFVQPPALSQKVDLIWKYQFE
jgi:hypothetical protein